MKQYLPEILGYIIGAIILILIFGHSDRIITIGSSLVVGYISFIIINKPKKENE